MDAGTSTGRGPVPADDSPGYGTTRATTRQTPQQGPLNRGCGPLGPWESDRLKRFHQVGPSIEHAATPRLHRPTSHGHMARYFLSLKGFRCVGRRQVPHCRSARARPRCDRQSHWLRRSAPETNVVALSVSDRCSARVTREWIGNSGPTKNGSPRRGCHAQVATPGSYLLFASLMRGKCSRLFDHQTGWITLPTLAVESIEYREDL